MATWASASATALALLALLVSAPAASAIGDEAIETANRARGFADRAPDVTQEATTCARSAADGCRAAAETWASRVSAVLAPLRGAIDRISGGDVDGEVAREQASAESRAAEVAASWTTWIDARAESIRSWLFGP